MTDHPTGQARSSARRVWLVGLGIVATYLSVFALIPRGAFYSPDSGGKYLQMLSYYWEGGLRCHVVYPGAACDPDGLFHGRRINNASNTSFYPYEDKEGRIHAGWTPWFPLLCRPLYAAFGMTGLHLVPLLAGLATILLAGRLAERLRPGAGPFAAATVALATPVLFYSMCFWEHTLAVAVALGALACILSPPLGPWGLAARPGRWAAALLLLFLAAVLRREHVFFVAAVALACACIHPNRRRFLPMALAGLLITAAVVTTLLILVRANWLGWFFPAHDSYVILQLKSLLSPEFWKRSAFNFLRMFLLNDYSTDLPLPVLCAGVAGLAACLGGVFASGRRRTLFILAGALLVSVPAAFLAGESSRYRSFNSILLPSPLALLALLPVADPSAGQTPRRLLAWVCGFFLTIVFIVLPAADLLHGGIEWGSRYTLVAIVLLNVLGVTAVAALCADGQAPRWLRRSASVVAAWLILLGAASALRGVDELRKTRIDLLDMQTLLTQLDEPVVTDLWWLGASLAPLTAQHELYIVSGRHPMREWLNVVGGRRPHFVYAGFPPAADAWESKTPTNMILNRVDRRVHGGLFITRYQIQTP